MRLNKFIAHCGVSSRRTADELIRAGRVRVNGITVTAMGTQIVPTVDIVQVDGQTIRFERDKSLTILLHKPPHVLSTRHDPQGRTTILSLVPPAYHYLYPVGRLDYLSEGLMLMSDDGDLTYRLTHPSFQHEKEYWVQIAGKVPEPALRKLRHGVEIEGGLARARVKRLAHIPPEQRFWLDREESRSYEWIIFTIHEGRKRQIRQMCQSVRLQIMRLVRIRIASLHIGDLAPGQWRHLTARQERAVAAIKAASPVESG